MGVNPAQIIAVLRTVHLFQALNDDRLEDVAAYFDVVQYPDGKPVFKQYAEPDNFYIVVSGSVLLKFDEGGTDHKEVAIGSGDYFGEEALSNSYDQRIASAVAKGAATLLRLRGIQVVDLIQEFPELQTGFHQILASYRLVTSRTFDWIDKDEVIHFIARRHSIVLIQMLFLPTVIAILLLIPLAYFYLILNVHQPLILAGAGFVTLVVMVWAVLASVDWNNDYYVITNRRLLLIRKVILLYESRQEVPLEAVLTIGTTSGFWGRLLNYGNINLRTYTGSLTFKTLEYPEQVAAVIAQYLYQAKNSTKEVQQEAIEDSIRQRFKRSPSRSYSSGSDGQDQEIEADVHSGAVTSALGNLFRLREEKDGSIMYRTHWFLLIVKTFFPNLVIAGLLAAIIIRLNGQLAAVPMVWFIGFCLLLGFFAWLWWIYQYVDWHNDVYIITNDQIIDVYRKPLAEEDRRAAPLKNIQSIEYKRNSIFGIIFNFGTIYIRVGDQDFTFDNVSNPSEVQRELFRHFMLFNQREKQAAADAERQRIGDWMEAYHKVMGEGSGQKPSEPGISG
ncbi:MAG TPA: PH domain-containing protein [Longilinea sp.]|nr:PH domain-containing protein [Longilinea sp.]